MNEKGLYFTLLSGTVRRISCGNWVGSLSTFILSNDPPNTKGPCKVIKRAFSIGGYLNMVTQSNIYPGSDRSRAYQEPGE